MTAPRTCEQLGLCQSRQGCTACSHDTKALPHGSFYFAPGAIECAPRRPHRWFTGARVWNAVVLATLATTALVALAAAIGISTGWLSVGALL